MPIASDLIESSVSSTAVQRKRLSVSIRGLEGAPLRNVQGLLDIWQFNDQAIPTVARLQFLHLAAAAQIRSALQPFGYYRATVRESLEDAGDTWRAVYEVDPGEQIRLGNIDWQLPGYETADASQDPFYDAFQRSALKSGAFLNQQNYDQLKRNWQTIAARLGYFDGEFVAREIRVDLKRYIADITLHYRPGRRYEFGEVSFSQDRQSWIRQSLLRGFSEIKDGQPFDAGLLQRMQSDLFATGYYEKVIVVASPDDAIDYRIPVRVELQHKNPRRYTFGLGYGTDTGVRLSAGTTGRRLNRRGHRIEVQGRVSEIGFGLAGEYIIPTGDPRSDRYGLRSSYERENSDTREFQTLSIGGYYQRRQGLWFETRSVDYQVEEFGLDSEVSTLLIPSIEWTRTNPLELDRRINVIDGSWLRLGLRGASDDLFSDTTFVQLRASFKTIHSFKAAHRIIARGGIGSTFVDDFEQLPATLRFFTGGDRTVRGYRYEVVAPLDSRQEVAGGKNLLELSLEYEVPFRDRWSAAVFADAGDAFDDSASIRTGIGIGLRWQSPIGPVRFDLARSLDDPGQGNDRLHFTIGPDL